MLGNESVIDGVPYKVKTGQVSCSTTGSPNTLVAAVTDKKIRVLSFFVLASVAGTVEFLSNNNSLLGPIIVALNVPLNHIWAPHTFIFETASGEALKLNQTGLLATCKVSVSYVEV